MLQNSSLQKGRILFEDGSCFSGKILSPSPRFVSEFIFNTSLTGYQESISDPSFCNQSIVFTNPHIGNVGVNQQDSESHQIWAKNLVLGSYLLYTSNYRAEEPLLEYCQKNKVGIIAGVDTRAITLHLRDKGSLKGMIVEEQEAEQGRVQILNEIKAAEPIRGQDLTGEVSQASRLWDLSTYNLESAEETHSQNQDAPLVLVFDTGVKNMILRLLVKYGARVRTLRQDEAIEDIFRLQPQAIVLGNGPGDPAANQQLVAIAKKAIEQNIPVLGICLGFQLLAQAIGAKTYKMETGHHGSNHPVLDMRHNRVLITSQNHGFAVDALSLGDGAEVRYISLFDGSLQGFSLVNKPVIGFQGHPEASPGTHDAEVIFQEFMQQVHHV